MKRKEKQVFLSFLKDELAVIVMYIISFSVILLYYTIEVSHLIAWSYPFLLMLFLLVLFEGVRFYHYVQRNQNLRKMVRCPGFDGKFANEFDHNLNESINELHRDYMQTIHENNNKAKLSERFSSSMIHNMKTPLSVTNLVLWRLEQQEITVKEAVPMLREENDKLLTAMNHVLELQRFAEAANDYQPKALNLLEQVRELINENKTLFIQNHVFPKLECNEKECVILVDPKWNKVMLQQFLTNAVKYSHVDMEEKETKYVMFELKTVEEENTIYVQLTIEDEGIGIPSYDIPRIFEAFFTGDNGRKHYNSSGIGLYLCSQIASRLNAKLNVHSTVSIGTKISIRYLTKL